MNKDAKRINPSQRPQIEMYKGHIRSSKRGFDGDGYPFHKAIKELRKEGYKIIYNRAKALYFNKGIVKQPKKIKVYIQLTLFDLSEY